MAVYYNEIDPYAAQWLRNLVSAGHIAAGDVDERSIIDVNADDLKGYAQCHFFAGIGGWSHALRLAGWPDDRPVWTGSCPCQPFSSAGRQEGHADERHLWPHWFRLIRECRPAEIFGEQVAGAIAFGWLDDVFNDLETEAYACAAGILPACSVGAPHKRDRLWFVANADGGGFSGSRFCQEQPERTEIISAGKNVADADITGSFPASHAGIHCSEESPRPWHVESQRRGGALAHSNRARIAHVQGQPTQAESSGGCQPDSNGWWIIEPSVGRVADGIPSRVGRLRAYGNAIVPAVASEFIKATM